MLQLNKHISQEIESSSGESKPVSSRSMTPCVGDHTKSLGITRKAKYLREGTCYNSRKSEQRMQCKQLYCSWMNIYRVRKI